MSFVLSFFSVLGSGMCELWEFLGLHISGDCFLSLMYFCPTPKYIIRQNLRRPRAFCSRLELLYNINSSFPALWSSETAGFPWSASQPVNCLQSANWGNHKAHIVYFSSEFCTPCCPMPSNSLGQEGSSQGRWLYSVSFTLTHSHNNPLKWILLLCSFYM